MTMHPDFIAAYNARRGPRSYTAEEFHQAFINRYEWEGDCLVWQGSKTRAGYGSVTIYGTTMVAHRVAYWMETGVKPPPRSSGMTLDHLCGNTSCVLPAHLELVSHAENNQRYARSITACPKGHEYTDANTYTEPVSGKRHCRTCKQEHDRRARKSKVFVCPLCGEQRDHSSRARHIRSHA